jgi:hypothetical protein
LPINLHACQKSIELLDLDLVALSVKVLNQTSYQPNFQIPGVHPEKLAFPAFGEHESSPSKRGSSIHNDSTFWTTRPFDRRKKLTLLPILDQFDNRFA